MLSVMWVAMYSSTASGIMVVCPSAFLRRMARRVSRSGGWMSVTRPDLNRVRSRSSRAGQAWAFGDCEGRRMRETGAGADGECVEGVAGVECCGGVVRIDVRPGGGRRRVGGVHDDLVLDAGKGQRVVGAGAGAEGGVDGN